MNVADPIDDLEDIMSADSEIKSAGANIQASTISTIVLGLAADPMARWVWPDSSEYLRIMPQFVKAFGGRAFEHGTAYITEGARAAALWLPPGVEPDEMAMDALMAQSLRPEIPMILDTCSREWPNIIPTSPIGICLSLPPIRTGSAKVSAHC